MGLANAASEHCCQVSVLVFAIHDTVIAVFTAAVLVVLVVTAAK